jgi:hypothetical protein
MWGQSQKYVGSSTSAGDETGRSVGVSLDTAVVGSPLYDSAGTDSGSAYLFESPKPALRLFIGDALSRPDLAGRKVSAQR